MKVPASTHIIGADNAGRRLDNYLQTIVKSVPKSYIYRIIRRGEVRVNGGRKKAGARLQLNDRVRVPPYQESSSTEPVISAAWQQSLAAAICHEDEHLLVINKPAGLAVHGGSGKAFGVIDILHCAIGEHLGLVHRLDKDTSGCLLIAKNPQICRQLQTQFREGVVDKTYRALLRGHFRRSEISTDACLTTQRADAGQAKTRVDVKGKPARSRFRLIENYEAGTAASAYVEVKIDTGRTHQIRVHAAHLGHPVCGDDRYGDTAFNKHMSDMGSKRLFLHAAKLGIVHPDTGKKTTFTATEPADIESFLSSLTPSTER
ncbi:MAG: RluA family pseudouridine synthase [Gammaproteobacteria bacterium]